MLSLEIFALYIRLSWHGYIVCIRNPPISHDMTGEVHVACSARGPSHRPLALKCVVLRRPSIDLLAKKGLGRRRCLHSLQSHVRLRSHHNLLLLMLSFRAFVPTETFLGWWNEMAWFVLTLRVVEVGWLDTFHASWPYVSCLFALQGGTCGVRLLDTSRPWDSNLLLNLLWRLAYRSHGWPIAVFVGIL